MDEATINSMVGNRFETFREIASNFSDLDNADLWDALVESYKYGIADVEQFNQVEKERKNLDKDFIKLIKYDDPMVEAKINAELMKGYKLLNAYNLIDGRMYYFGKGEKDGG